LITSWCSSCAESNRQRDKHLLPLRPLERNKTWIHPPLKIVPNKRTITSCLRLFFKTVYLWVFCFFFSSSSVGTNELGAAEEEDSIERRTDTMLVGVCTWGLLNSLFELRGKYILINYSNKWVISSFSVNISLVPLCLYISALFIFH